MAEVHAWLKDKDGYMAGSVDYANGDDLEALTKSAAANGQTVIEKGKDPDATRPLDRPLSPAAQEIQTKATRLEELRAKGYVNLTQAERDEATALRFDLGM
jgi:hypothetical protein